MDIEKEEQLWEKEKDILERKQKIKNERSKFKPKKITTTKLLTFFLFLNCTLIELFVAYVTIRSLDISAFSGMSPDFTPLITLVGAVVSEVIGFAIYCLKSVKENSKNGIIYETTMANYNNAGGKG